MYISLRRDKWCVKTLCEILGVSESGYYRSLKSQARPSRRELLLVEIKKILDEHEDNDNYGSERMHLALTQKGIETSQPTVYRTMKEAGLIHKAKRHPNGITKEDAQAQKSENLIKRDFSSDAPNKKWLMDITEIPCFDGKLYLAPVFECFNGEIIGFAMDDHMRAELCVKAFEDACRNQRARQMTLHSDRGSQFTSTIFRETLEKYGAVQSMSGTGKCYDNARMESFFATLKKEKLYRMDTTKMTREMVKTIIFRYIIVYYNKIRVYTSNPGGLSPTAYRRSYAKDRALAA